MFSEGPVIAITVQAVYGTKSNRETTAINTAFGLDQQVQAVTRSLRQ
jgi:hypothetical protein